MWRVRRLEIGNAGSLPGCDGSFGDNSAERRSGTGYRCAQCQCAAGGVVLIDRAERRFH